MEGITDALTGVALGATRGLMTCPHCGVFYHRESGRELQDLNAGCCVVCQRAGLVPVALEGQNSRAFSAPRPKSAPEPEVLSLANLSAHVGRVVVFEGRVEDARWSRGGRVLALFFQQGDWSRSFKLVIYENSVGRMGGSYILLGLIGRTIRVRGLLRQNPRFGMEIIATDRSMILAVR